MKTADKNTNPISLQDAMFQATREGKLEFVYNGVTYWRKSKRHRTWHKKEK